MDPARLAKLWALVDELHANANAQRAYNFIPGRLLEERAADEIVCMLAALGYYRERTQ
jgi:hypothetical protein